MRTYCVCLRSSQLCFLKLLGPDASWCPQLCLCIGWLISFHFCTAPNSPSVFGSWGLLGIKKRPFKRSWCAKRSSISHRGIPQLPSALLPRRDGRRISSSASLLRCARTMYAYAPRNFASSNSLALTPLGARNFAYVLDG